MLNLSKRKFKKKKVLSAKIKTLKVKKKVRKPIKKELKKKFFLQNYSLEKKNALILRLLKLRKIDSAFLNVDHKFELRTSFYDLVKLSQALKTALRPENSVDVLPFFFQESFLVDSSIEQRKKKNFLHLIKKPFCFFTKEKKRKSFGVTRRIFKKKNLLRLRKFKRKSFKKGRIVKIKLTNGEEKQLLFSKQEKKSSQKNEKVLSAAFSKAKEDFLKRKNKPLEKKLQDTKGVSFLQLEKLIKQKPLFSEQKNTVNKQSSKKKEKVVTAEEVLNSPKKERKKKQTNSNKENSSKKKETNVKTSKEKKNI